MFCTVGCLVIVFHSQRNPRQLAAPNYCVPTYLLVISKEGHESFQLTVGRVSAVSLVKMKAREVLKIYDRIQATSATVQTFPCVRTKTDISADVIALLFAWSFMFSAEPTPSTLHTPCLHQSFAFPRVRRSRVAQTIVVQKARHSQGWGGNRQVAPSRGESVK